MPHLTTILCLISAAILLILAACAISCTISDALHRRRRRTRLLRRATPRN